MYLYVFWLRKGPSIKSVRNWKGGLGGVSSKMRKAAYRGRECHASCVRTHLHYLFSCFWQHFCLIVSCFICRNLTLSLIKKDVFIRTVIFSNKINFCRHQNYFCEAKSAKMLLILIKQYLRYTLDFYIMPYFKKTLYSVAQEITSMFTEFV